MDTNRNHHFCQKVKDISSIQGDLLKQAGPQTNAKFASMRKHELLPIDVLYIAQIRFKDVATSYLPICPRLGDMVIKADNEGFGYAGWQLACLLASGAASFDIALAEHAMSAYIPDQPPLIRLLAIVEDLSGFLTNLKQRLLPCTKTQNEQLQLQEWKVIPAGCKMRLTFFADSQTDSRGPKATCQILP